MYVKFLFLNTYVVYKKKYVSSKHLRLKLYANKFIYANYTGTSNVVFENVLTVLKCKSILI